MAHVVTAGVASMTLTTSAGGVIYIGREGSPPHNYIVQVSRGHVVFRGGIAEFQAYLMRWYAEDPLNARGPIELKGMCEHISGLLAAYGSVNHS